MKEVYEVIFDDGEAYEGHCWTVAVCSSKDKAEEIARMKTEEFSKKIARAYELRELGEMRALTKEEKDEEDELHDLYLWDEESPWKCYVNEWTIPYYE